MFVNTFIGSHIRSLIAELRRLSGKSFAEDRHLASDEAWKPEKRIELFALMHGKVSIVESLRELSNDLHGVETFLVHDGQVVRGYEQVWEKFHEILSIRLVVTTEKFNKGTDPDWKPDWKTWAFGLIDIDEVLLDEFRQVLNDAETTIRNTPLPDPVDLFQPAYLENDLKKAGILTTTVRSPQDAPTPETDSVKFEYFDLDDGRVIGIAPRDGVSFTSKQVTLARELIRNHLNETAKLDQFVQTINNKLRRAGHKTSCVRFVRSESELGWAPERSVSLDTEQGFLEVRTPEALSEDERKKIGLIAREALSSVGIVAYLTEEFPTSAVHLVERVLNRFNFAAWALKGRRMSKEPFEMNDEYDVQDLLQAILETYFDDVIAEDPNPKFAGKSTRIDLFLKKARIFIEIKRPRMTQSEGEVGEELIKDIPHYSQRNDCDTLFCFVYDPDHRIKQPEVFKTDIESQASANTAIRVVVNQN